MEYWSFTLSSAFHVVRVKSYQFHISFISRCFEKRRPICIYLWGRRYIRPTKKKSNVIVDPVGLVRVYFPSRIDFRLLFYNTISRTSINELFNDASTDYPAVDRIIDGDIQLPFRCF